MSGYYNVSGISEAVFLTFTDWIGYVKDDGSYGYLLQNGVPVSGDWSTITNKPATFPATLGTTSTTAKAGNYKPTWSEINSVIPAYATFAPIIGTSPTSAKAGNWYPTWSEISGKPSLFPASVSWGDIQNKPTTLNDFGITNGVSSGTLAAELSNYVMQSTFNSAVTNKLSNPTPYSASRSFGSHFQADDTRPYFVSYSVGITTTSSITGSQEGEVILEMSPDYLFVSDIQTVAVAGLGVTYTLAAALQGVSKQTANVSAMVPAGWYVRLRTVDITGTPSYTIRASQEVVL